MKKTLLGLMLSVSLLAGGAITANADDNAQTSTGDVAFEGGSLTIDNGNTSVDSANLDFGSHKIDASDTGVYTNKNANAAVSVADLRGNPTGWSLGVSQGTQFTSTSGKELENAVITLHSQLDTENSSVTDENAAKVTDEVVLTPGTTAAGTTTPIMTAGNGQGNGTSVDSLVGSVLTVPEKSARVAESYTTTLTWELSTTPENS